MSKQVSTTVIGSFVLSGIVLLIMAVLVLGTGSFWKQTRSFVLYFEESVKGLSVGSPVMFRGVQIGAVKSIILLADQEKDKVDIPVTIEIDMNKFQLKTGDWSDIYDRIDRLISLGLRAQLDLQSIVTGQLIIQLDFLPDTEVHLSTIEHEYPEIPTIRSPLDELTGTLRELPVKQIAHHLQEISEQINELLQDERIDRILGTIDSAAVNADKLIEKVDTRVDSLSDKLESTMAEAVQLLAGTTEDITKAADNVSALLTEIQRNVEPVSHSLLRTLDSAQKTLEQANKTLITVDRFVEDSDTRVKLNRSFDEIVEAARS
ncbi:MAG TPA: MCE family protein, partial [Thermodesulfobacteriaceae bacterium]|nr:MCE family protein [Thermodesulfobacteriaceae bacterium]